MCAIAESIRLQIPEAKNISVDVQTMRFTIPDTGKRFLFLTPKRVQQFIVLWDTGIKPAPFRFKLNNPGQVIASKAGEKRIRKASIHQNNNGAIVKIDGSAPPKSTWGSSRRAFGIRGIKLTEEEAEKMIAAIRAAIEKKDQ
jgi:hypothetical protein